MADEVPNYASNSKINKKPAEPERPRLEKAIEGDAQQRKRPLGKRLAETFTGDDAQSVGQFVLFEVIVPAVKATITDVVSKGVEQFFYGSSGGRSRSGADRRQYPRTNYSEMSSRSDRGYGRREEPARRELSSKARAAHDFDEVTVMTRGEGDLVIERLRDALEQYGSVTVADFYDLVGLTGDFTDNKYGWVDLRGADLSRVRGGYVFDLPRPIVLD